MEPVTHILTGACLARTGLNRRAAYTTAAMAVGAELPDIDTLWGLRGPVAGFRHHRGITHTFLGIPFEAALLVGGVYAFHRLRARRAALPGRQQRTTLAVPGHAVPPSTAAPVRWGLLYAYTLLALLSHLWLDYTNNYGLRPFFPFNPRWYAASITFIFDPAMFLLLLAAVVLPPLFRLIGSEVGARRQPFVARGWAVVALLGVCALWGWRGVEHSRAVALAMAQSIPDPASKRQPNPQQSGADADTPLPPLAPERPVRYLAAQRVLASPDPLDPRRWYTVTDCGPEYHLATVSLETGSVVEGTAPSQPKPGPSREERLAEGSALGRAYLDWSPMPFLDSSTEAAGGQTGDGDNLSRDSQSVTTIVTFRDPRFLGQSLWLDTARSRAPLTGTVQLDASGKVVRETMGGKAQR